MATNSAATIVHAPLEETGTPIAVAIRPHALQRFVERVSPGLDIADAKAVIAQLASFASITARRPKWLGSETAAPLYLVLGDLAFVLVADDASPGRLIAVTCLVSGGDARLHRRRRTRRSRARRRAHRFDERTLRRIQRRAEKRASRRRRARQITRRATGARP